MRRLWTVTATIALLLPASPEGAQALQRLIDVRQIATDTLRDVAAVTYVRGRPTIYYNPVLLQGFGPRMAEFFFAHEYGHIHYGHAGGALAHEEGDVSLVRQAQELEADCYAARTVPDRESVKAAIRFFRRMGPYRYDVFHPTGSQRAAKILACLPQAPAEPAARTAARKVASPERDMSFVLQAPAPSAGEHAIEARVWIDGHAVGTVSSIRQPRSIVVRGLSAGTHRYRVSVELYTFDAMLQLNAGGAASGEGLITVDEESVVTVRWRAGEPAALVSR